MDHPARVGKYEIEKFLGGGMSRVYLAKDSVLGRRVAIKILTDSGSGDTEAKARFLMEARLASNITHENIISVYDFGEDQGRPFIVMEYLEGESLRAALKARRVGDFAQRIRIALQVARAVGYIHSRRIIHRDLKPENIHLEPGGKVKLMDFGIAKSEGLSLTRSGFTLGTPYYMAPEQVLGQVLTPQADVYSFGILLFELLTGTKPVGGDSVETIFDHILTKPLNMVPLLSLNLPEEINQLVTRCTARQPAQRPNGLGPVCEELERILEPSKSGGPRIPMAMGPMVEMHHATMTVNVPTGDGPARWPALLEKLPPALRSQGGLMVLAGAGVLAAAVIVAGVLAMLHVI
jgi:eukaryotic-like serine/threonine-protein kinase